MLRLNVTKVSTLEKYNVENISISEMYLNSGRVVGELLLLIMGIVNNNVFNIVSLCVCAVSVVLYFIHTTIVCRRVTPY